MTAQEFNFRVSNSYDTLKGFTYKFTKDVEDANDLIQETMLRALKNREKYRDHTNLKAWLYTIMRNIFINSYRRKTKFEYTVTETEDINYWVDTKKKSYDSPEEFVSRNEINQQIGGLKEIYKVPFEMYTQGFKYHEIAEAIDIPIGTVKTRIHIARKRLAELLPSN